MYGFWHATSSGGARRDALPRPVAGPVRARMGMGCDRADVSARLAAGELPGIRLRAAHPADRTLFQTIRLLLHADHRLHADACGGVALHLCRSAVRLYASAVGRGEPQHVRPTGAFQFRPAADLNITRGLHTRSKAARTVVVLDSF